MKKIIMLVSIAFLLSSCSISIEELKTNTDAEIAKINVLVEECEKSEHAIEEFSEEAGLMLGTTVTHYTQRGDLLKIEADIVADLSGRIMSFYYIDDFIVLDDVYWFQGSRDNVYMEGRLYFNKDMTENFNDEDIPAEIVEQIRESEAKYRNL